MLPALVQREGADERLMERIAVQLAEFHSRAATGRGVDEYASVAALRANWVENFEQTERFIGGTLDVAERDEIRAFVEQFLDGQSDMLERRIGEGRIRDGHGDLHAASICVKGRRLYMFDCIEFNTRFRCADVAAEVAFLAMDLEHLARADLGHAFVEAYVRQSRDVEVRRVLEFYKCYRAYVRGKVLSFRLAEPKLTSAEAARLSQEASAYFDLAASYTHGLGTPLLLVTMGLPASGKTTVARAVAQRLGLVHLSSDVVRKRLVGVRPSAHHSEAFGRGLYSRAMTRRTYAALKRQAARWLRTGQSVVVDATFGQPAERSAIRQVARRTGARLVMVECQAEEAVLRSRLAAREVDPDRVSDARLALLPALRGAFSPPAEIPDVVEVDTTVPLERVLQQILPVVRQAGAARLRPAA